MDLFISASVADMVDRRPVGSYLRTAGFLFPGVAGGRFGGAFSPSNAVA